MPEITIIQMSAEEFRTVVNSAVQDGIQQARDMLCKTYTKEEEKTYLNVSDICKMLNIGRTRFEHYKKELIQAGMFKLGKENSSYLMKQEDFDKWLRSKQAKKE